MKAIALSFACILVSVLFLACEKDDVHIIPSDNVITVTHPVSDFNDLNISDPFKAYVTFSQTEPELRIEANDNLHALIEVEQSNGKLSIRLEDNTNISGGPAVLNIFLTTNDIESIKAQGTAQVFLQNQWEGNRVEIELSGASELAGALNADRLYSRLTGACNLELEGNVNEFEIKADGASNMEGFDFATNDFTADLEGGCNVYVTVQGKLSVEASGASTVYYKGNGIVEEQDLSGGSQIIKM